MPPAKKQQKLISIDFHTTRLNLFTDNFDVKSHYNHANYVAKQVENLEKMQRRSERKNSRGDGNSKGQGLNHLPQFSTSPPSSRPSRTSAPPSRTNAPPSGGTPAPGFQSFTPAPLKQQQRQFKPMFTLDMEDPNLKSDTHTFVQDQETGSFSSPSPTGARTPPYLGITTGERTPLTTGARTGVAEGVKREHDKKGAYGSGEMGLFTPPAPPLVVGLHENQQQSMHIHNNNGSTEETEKNPHTQSRESVTSSVSTGNITVGKLLVGAGMRRSANDDRSGSRVDGSASVPLPNAASRITFPNSVSRSNAQGAHPQLLMAPNRLKPYPILSTPPNEGGKLLGFRPQLLLSANLKKVEGPLAAKEVIRLGSERMPMCPGDNASSVDSCEDDASDDEKRNESGNAKSTKKSKVIKQNRRSKVAEEQRQRKRKDREFAKAQEQIKLLETQLDIKKDELRRKSRLQTDPLGDRSVRNTPSRRSECSAGSFGTQNWNGAAAGGRDYKTPRERRDSEYDSLSMTGLLSARGSRRNTATSDVTTPRKRVTLERRGVNGTLLSLPAHEMIPPFVSPSARQRAYTDQSLLNVPSMNSLPALPSMPLSPSRPTKAYDHLRTSSGQSCVGTPSHTSRRSRNSFLAQYSDRIDHHDDGGRKTTLTQHNNEQQQKEDKKVKRQKRDGHTAGAEDKKRGHGRIEGERGSVPSEASTTGEAGGESAEAGTSPCEKTGGDTIITTTGSSMPLGKRSFLVDKATLKEQKAHQERTKERNGREEKVVKNDDDYGMKKKARMVETPNNGATANLQQESPKRSGAAQFPVRESLKFMNIGTSPPKGRRGDVSPPAVSLGGNPPNLRTKTNDSAQNHAQMAARPQGILRATTSPIRVPPLKLATLQAPGRTSPLLVKRIDRSVDRSSNIPRVVVQQPMVQTGATGGNAKNNACPQNNNNNYIPGNRNSSGGMASRVVDIKSKLTQIRDMGSGAVMKMEPISLGDDVRSKGQNSWEWDKMSNRSMMTIGSAHSTNTPNMQQQNAHLNGSSSEAPAGGAGGNGRGAAPHFTGYSTNRNHNSGPSGSSAPPPLHRGHTIAWTHSTGFKNGQLNGQGGRVVNDTRAKLVGGTTNTSYNNNFKSVGGSDLSHPSFPFRVATGNPPAAASTTSTPVCFYIGDEKSDGTSSAGGANGEGRRDLTPPFPLLAPHENQSYPQNRVPRSRNLLTGVTFPVVSGGTMLKYRNTWPNGEVEGPQGAAARGRRSALPNAECDTGTGGGLVEDKEKEEEEEEEDKGCGLVEDKGNVTRCSPGEGNGNNGITPPVVFISGDDKDEDDKDDKGSVVDATENLLALGRISLTKLDALVSPKQEAEAYTPGSSAGCGEEEHVILSAHDELRHHHAQETERTSEVGERHVKDVVRAKKDENVGEAGGKRVDNTENMQIPPPIASTEYSSKNEIASTNRWNSMESIEFDGKDAFLDRVSHSTVEFQNSTVKISAKEDVQQAAILGKSVSTKDLSLLETGGGLRDEKHKDEGLRLNINTPGVRENVSSTEFSSETESPSENEYFCVPSDDEPSLLKKTTIEREIGDNDDDESHPHDESHLLPREASRKIDDEDKNLCARGEEDDYDENEVDTLIVMPPEFEYKPLTRALLYEAAGNTPSSYALEPIAEKELDEEEFVDDGCELRRGVEAEVYGVHHVASIMDAIREKETEGDECGDNGNGSIAVNVGTTRSDKAVDVDNLPAVDVDDGRAEDEAARWIESGRVVNVAKEQEGMGGDNKTKGTREAPKKKDDDTEETRQQEEEGCSPAKDVHQNEAHKYAEAVRCVPTPLRLVPVSNDVVYENRKRASRDDFHQAHDIIVGVTALEEKINNGDDVQVVVTHAAVSQMQESLDVGGESLDAQNARIVAPSRTQNSSFSSLSRPHARISVDEEEGAANKNGKHLLKHDEGGECVKEEEDAKKKIKNYNASPVVCVPTTTNDALDGGKKPKDDEVPSKDGEKEQLHEKKEKEDNSKTNDSTMNDVDDMCPIERMISQTLERMIETSCMSGNLDAAAGNEDEKGETQEGNEDDGELKDPINKAIIPPAAYPTGERIDNAKDALLPSVVHHANGVAASSSIDVAASFETKPHNKTLLFASSVEEKCEGRKIAAAASQGVDSGSGGLRRVPCASATSSSSSASQPMLVSENEKKKDVNSSFASKCSAQQQQQQQQKQHDPLQQMIEHSLLEIQPTKKEDFGLPCTLKNTLYSMETAPSRQPQSTANFVPMASTTIPLEQQRSYVPTLTHSPTAPSLLRRANSQENINIRTDTTTTTPFFPAATEKRSTPLSTTMTSVSSTTTTSHPLNGRQPQLQRHAFSSAHPHTMGQSGSLHFAHNSLTPPAPRAPPVGWNTSMGSFQQQQQQQQQHKGGNTHNAHAPHTAGNSNTSHDALFNNLFWNSLNTTPSGQVPPIMNNSTQQPSIHGSTNNNNNNNNNNPTSMGSFHGLHLMNMVAHTSLGSTFPPQTGGSHPNHPHAHAPSFLTAPSSSGLHTANANAGQAAGVLNNVGSSHLAPQLHRR